MDLKGQKIFLTGASGFVGFRLAQVLSRDYGAEVHALVHRFGTVGSARLATLPRVRIFGGDLRDPISLREAMRDCTRVIHCAFGTSGTLSEQEEITVQGTRRLMELSAETKVERFVHFSTAAVLENRSPYCVMKLRSEEIVRENGKRLGVPFVILRPTSVWGPFSFNWTISPAELILSRVPFLPMGGRGQANVVFLDNLIDAAVLALTEKGALGETLLINDDAPETWKDLYGGYAQELGLELVLKEASALNGERTLRDRFSGIIGQGISRIRTALRPVNMARRLWFQLPAPLQRQVQEWGALSPELRELYSAQSRASNQEAKDRLHWFPRTSFPEALRRTGMHLRHYHEQR